MAAIDDYAAGMRDAEGSVLGEGLIRTREAKDRLEAVFAEGLRRFDKSGEYAADGSLDLVAWLRSKCKLSGGAAADRVGNQHVAVMARTAEHVGAAAVRKAEASPLKAAETLDPGQFVGVAKNFEHQVDAQAALAEANRAHQRRYVNLSEPNDGMVRIDGLLDTEGGAILRTRCRGSCRRPRTTTARPDSVGPMRSSNSAGGRPVAQLMALVRDHT